VTQQGYCWATAPRSTIFFRQVNGLAPEDPANAISSGFSQGTHLDTTTAHYAQLLKETRPPPAVLADKSKWKKWEPFLPKEQTPGAGQRLVSEILPWEVYLCIFPSNKRLLGLMTPCEPGCKLCASYRQRLEKFTHGDPMHPSPKWVPSLNMCKAAGSDGLIGEILRFSRPADHTKRWEHRMKVCTALAALFNRWMVEGVPETADFAMSVLTPLLKRGTPGAPVDPRNPADTRPICVGNLLPRVFDLVLLSRLSHWAINQGIVSLDMQAGFIQTLSAEFQVLAFVETVTLRKKQKLDTSLLFVDISGACDDVHQEALWLRGNP